MRHGLRSTLVHAAEPIATSAPRRTGEKVRRTDDRSRSSEARPRRDLSHRRAVLQSTKGLVRSVAAPRFSFMRSTVGSSVRVRVRKTRCPTACLAAADEFFLFAMAHLRDRVPCVGESGGIETQRHRGTEGKRRKRGVGTARVPSPLFFPVFSVPLCLCGSCSGS